jgi:hypothetical protein
VKRARNSVRIVKGFSKPPNEWLLKELIFYLFDQKGVTEIDLIHEFCEIQYGPLWDVLINFEAFCFDNPQSKLPGWIDSFLTKKMR